MFDQQPQSQPQTTREQEAARRALGQGVNQIAFEIVDISGILSELDENTSGATSRLHDLRSNANSIGTAVTGVSQSLDRIERATNDSVSRAQTALEDMKDGTVKARSVATWVQTLGSRMTPMEDRLNEVRNSARRIADIATEVDMLAINAKIEAARAGEQGRGFSVVADAVGKLSHQTYEVTRTISEELQAFSEIVSSMIQEAADKTEEASKSLASTERNDTDVAAIAETLGSTAQEIQSIAAQARTAGEQSTAFVQVFQQVAGLMEKNAGGITDSRRRFDGLNDRVEHLVQLNAATGAKTGDQRMIETVMEAAAKISESFEREVQGGRLSLNDLFDEAYTAIPGSNPEQVLTRFTTMTDRVLPAIQEPILSLDPRIVFCAAVDRNGYLPTHNTKFCQPQGADPVWNAANSRNRRIFDDRVGLKAGASTAPFLLQVYRRDMGGGNTVLMKDLSAPIRVGGRHWGGLRLAYKPE